MVAPMTTRIRSTGTKEQDVGQAGVICEDYRSGEGEPFKPGLNRARSLRWNQVGLVQQDQVGLGQLSADRVPNIAILGGCLHGLCVGQDDNAFDIKIGQQTGGLGDRARHANSAGFNQQEVGTGRSRQEGFKRADQVITDGAADASPGKAQDVSVRADDQVRIYGDLAEVIDQDGDPAPRRISQEMIDQGGLAGAKIAADHDGRN